MKYMKKCVWLSAAICVLALLTACTSQDKPAANGNDPKPPTVQASDNQGAEVSTQTSSQGSENSTAVVTIPPDHAGVYTAEMQRYSKADIDRFLSQFEDGIADGQENTFDTSTQYRGSCKSGKEFFYLESSGQVAHTVFQYFDTEKYQTYSNYPIYSNEELYETNALYSVGWMFTEPKDFAFATAQEAESNVRKALANLGIADVTLLRTLYIDHNTMEEAGKKLATDPVYAPVGGAKENNGYTIRDDWSEKDDAYMFSFGITVGNAALSTRFDLQETAVYNGSSVIVWYSADGIDVLFIEMPWKVGELTEEPAKIVSSQKAMDVAQEKMQGILTFQNTTIYDPVLEYQYRQEKDQWILFPVWRVMVSYQYPEVEETIYSYVCVDALTGLEL